MPALRVVHLYYHLEVGGIETRLLDVLPRHDRNRVQVRLLCTRRLGALAPALRDAGIPVDVRRHHSKVPLVLAALPFALLLRRFRPHVLHAHEFMPSLVGTVAARMARVPVVVVNYHSIRREWSPREIRRERRVAAGRTATVHVSGAVRDAYGEHFGRLAGDHRVIYNGVDVLRFATPPSQARMRELRQELRLDGAGPVLLAVGSLTPMKAHDDMIAAFAAVRAARPDAALLLAGDGPLRGRTEAELRARGLGSAVRLLGLRPDVRDLYHLADVHILTSLGEGFSNAVLEAMAAGRPQVLTDVGGNREAVGDSGAAILSPPGDAARFARALLSVLASPEEARRMGLGARRRSESFSVEEQVQRTEELYFDLVRGSLPSASQDAVPEARLRETSPGGR